MQISERDLTFNIIYMPGTFRLLRVFLLSLLDHSASCRFRLISNGCGEEEMCLIQVFCARYPRLSWQVVATGTPRAHGEVLSLLQEQEESPVFAFMDSDIFATAPFLEELLTAAGTADAVFSCSPFWAAGRGLRASRESMVLSGVFNELADGTCVGGSYFAVYDNQKLSLCRAETTVDLGLYLWRQIPGRLRRELRAAGKKKGIYDTGKLVNILLGHRGAALTFRISPGLFHVGGISLVASPRTETRLRTRLRMAMPPVLLALYRTLRAGQAVSLEESRALAQRELQRSSISRRCCSVLSAFAGLAVDNSDACTHPGIEEELEVLESRLKLVLQTYGLEIQGGPVPDRRCS